MGGGTVTSDVTVNPDGTVTIVCSAPDVGTGTLMVVAKVAAECFGIPLENVRLAHGDTDDLPTTPKPGRAA
jgi:CO/xanthine dehydrogenase Mo-binding subunit